MLTRIGVGGTGKTYGTVTDKSESTPTSPRPGDLYTRIAVGGIGQTYGTVTDKTEDTAVAPRPGGIFTRIGVGGVGIKYNITAKAETEIVALVGGGDSSSRRKVYRTWDVYDILRIAREAVEEPGIKPTELLLREQRLYEAERDVREQLAKQRDVPQEALADFVSGLRFAKDLGDIETDDMEQILLILMIDEITDD